MKGSEKQGMRSRELKARNRRECGKQEVPAKSRKQKEETMQVAMFLSKFRR